MICCIDSPVGPLELTANASALLRLSFKPKGTTITPVTDGIVTEARNQLAAYFAGSLHTFDLPFNYSHVGTEFQHDVWAALQTIPYGETISYKELAASIDRPKAIRAVGQANHHNPLAIIIPCHRVIGSNGSLTGFGGGLDAKRFLLELEREATQSLAA